MAVEKIPYYPGCSLEGLATSYDASAKVVGRYLGIELADIEDFNCCGALEGKHTGEVSSLVLSSRNLALAQKQYKAKKVIAPCNGCQYSLGRANAHFREQPDLLNSVNAALQESGQPTYDGSTEVDHLLSYLYNTQGVEGIKGKTRRPLEGLKVACYYGCLYTRPGNYTGAGKDKKKDNPEYPVFMDQLLQGAGATIVEFEAKTDCCGGAHSLADEETSLTLSGKVLAKAKEAGADLLATNCPLCGAALDIKHPQLVERFGEAVNIPVVYFTQLLGLAMGASAGDMKFGHHFSKPGDILKRKGFI